MLGDNSGILVTKLFWNVQLFLQNENGIFKWCPFVWWALELLLAF